MPTYDGTGLLPVARFYQELLRRIEALPGVAAAAATSAAPLHQGLFPVTLSAYPVAGSSAALTDQLAYGNQVTPEFFATLGIGPLAGRLLKPNDRRGGANVAVVNQAYARAYLDGENAVGRHITLPGGGSWRLVFRAAIGPSFAPHVYLNGTLIFIAGLAIVRAHNVWVWRWPVLITVVGWLATVLGLGRMAAPVSAQQAGQSSVVVYGSLVTLLAIGFVVTYKSYYRAGN